MSVCGFCLIGKKHEIEKLGEICNKVGALLKTKYNKGTEEFFDCTGISIFEILRKPNECITFDSVIDGRNSENEKAMDWIECGSWKKAKLQYGGGRLRDLIKYRLKFGRC
jgi:hypothetical protein